MTLLGSVIVRRRRGQAKKISWKANACLEKWVKMVLNMSDKVYYPVFILASLW